MTSREEISDFLRVVYTLIRGCREVVINMLDTPGTSREVGSGLFFQELSEKIDTNLMFDENAGDLTSGNMVTSE